jgi:hypothetical protein
MRIITGFDSSTTEEEANSFSQYIEVLKALEHSLEIAENAFSRIAKSQVRRFVGNKVPRMRADEVKGIFPHWHAETSITIDLESPRPHNVLLAHLVKHFGQYLLNSLLPSAMLVESLSTRILRVGPTLYQFRLKQKWVLDE